MLKPIDNTEVKTKVQQEKWKKVNVFSYDEGIKESQTSSKKKFVIRKEGIRTKMFFQRTDRSIVSQKSKPVKSTGVKKRSKS